MDASTIAVIVSVVSLSASIISPIIVRAMINKHELRKIQIEIYERRRIENLEHYFKAVAGNIETLGQNEDFLASRSLIYLYAPKSMYPDIDHLHELVRNTYHNPANAAEARELLAKIISQFDTTTPLVPHKRLQLFRSGVK